MTFALCHAFPLPSPCVSWDTWRGGTQSTIYLRWGRRPPASHANLTTDDSRIYVTWYTSGLPEATGVRLRLPNSHALLGVKKRHLVRRETLRTLPTSGFVADRIIGDPQTSVSNHSHTHRVHQRHDTHTRTVRIFTGRAVTAPDIFHS